MCELNKKKIKAAIFDVDGTILDSMKIWEEAGERYLSKKGRVAEKDLKEKLKEMTLEESAAYLKETYALPDTEKRIAEEIVEMIQNFYFYEAECKPGVEEVIQWFYQNKIPITIATSSDAICVKRALRRLGLETYIDRIFTCEEAGAGKTRPDIYQHAAKWMQVKPESTCVFEDALFAVKTAKAAGFQVVGIYDFYQKQDWKTIQEYADFDAGNWREILAKIKK